jgi:hypothetical protein
MVPFCAIINYYSAPAKGEIAPFIQIIFLTPGGMIYFTNGVQKSPPKGGFTQFAEMLAYTNLLIQSSEIKLYRRRQGHGKAFALHREAGSHD